MEAPVASFILGDLRDALLEQFLGAYWQMEIEGFIGGCCSPQQTGIESHYLLHRRPRYICYETKVNAVVRLNAVDKERWIWGQIIQAILLGILGQDGHRQDDGDIILGFRG